MNYAAIILTCPLCSNKVGADFIGKKCPNPECLYKFGKKALEQKNSFANDKRVLRLMKKMHKDATLKKSQLKKEFDLSDDDISLIKPYERYGEPRYYREDVAAYLQIKRNRPLQRKLLF
jgi:hypothetical protein